ncbi:hypothetical protein [Chlamydia abortus]|nr:hypothetical protein [Chlamydia abortus]AUS60276.1 uncharacterized protein CHAB577_0855 [Chlamydia abortus]QRR31544.1 hypothetical protein JS522_04125 [Chlamydia abortus]SFV98084.1 Uncharacterised protein [Chlamydia abortus]SFV98665.1 Uncharacterised protein [Chlamydia abortus]SFW02010.1 Uncharacterised protein [Chlamydia abortus]
MRILLALLSCFLLPTQLVQAIDEPMSTVVSEDCCTCVFQDYDAALKHAQDEGISLVIVLLSRQHNPLLEELIEEGLDLSDFFGCSLEDLAVIAVLQPEVGDEENSSKVQDFQSRFPSTQFPEAGHGVFLVTVIVDGSQDTVLDITQLEL